MNSEKDKFIEICAKLETSNHCGYCTGEECVYEVKTKKYYVKPPSIPEWIQDYKIGQRIKISYYDWQSLLPVPNINGGFETCSCSEEVKQSGLLRHDYRYTILSVRMVENTKKKEHKEK